MASKLNIEILSSERIHASTRPSEVHHAPLSIIDATVGGFGSTEMIPLYDAPHDNHKPLTISHFRTSLQTTLAAYPQWCGRLHFSDYDPTSTSHLHRYGRFVLSYGGDQEPGVEFVVARTSKMLSSLVPTSDERAQLKVWDATDFPGKELVPSTTLAVSDLNNSTAPGVVIQITQFGCGGLAVAVKMSHPLADAHCMSLFVHDWAATTRAQLQGETPPVPAPVFNPQMLDRAAAGDIDAAVIDTEISRQARELPCHRHDWWVSADDCPFPTTSTQIPEPLKSQPHDAPGDRMPWQTWDLAAPVKHLVLHFSGSEINGMQKAATTIEPKVSKHDAIVAHIWNCVNRARGLINDDGPVYLDYTLGLRARTSPPLGPRFVGSPIMLAAVASSGHEASQDDAIAILASHVRRTVGKFTPDAVAAHLHDKAYDQYPQRLWQTFLGSRHLLTTSWIHTKVYQVDFGGGTPRYVEAVMPQLDGLFQLMEARPRVRLGDMGLRSWSDVGIDCQLCLKEDTAERLLADPLLRRFA